MVNISQLDSIYLLILNYQSYDDTIKYVDCLKKQKNVILNILIIDNLSPNNSFEILNKEYINTDGVEVISSGKNGGYAYGNNFGLKFIKNRDVDYILISNNDIEINDSLLLYKMIEKYKLLKNPAFVSPLMYDNDMPSECPAWKIPTLKDDLVGSLRIFEKVFKYNRSYIISPKLEYIEVDCLPGSFFMARKDIFYNLGLMDENTFLYMEEAILAFKARERNFVNYVLLDLKYHHLTSKTISSQLSNIKMRKHLIESRIYFHKEYLKTNVVGIALIKFFFVIWKIETFLIKYFK